MQARLRTADLFALSSRSEGYAALRPRGNGGWAPRRGERRRGRARGRGGRGDRRLVPPGDSDCISRSSSAPSWRIRASASAWDVRAVVVWRSDSPSLAVAMSTLPSTGDFSLRPLPEPGTAMVEHDELSFSVVSSLDELERLGSQWDSFVRSMSRPSPFLLHGWVSEWWRAFGSGADLSVTVARRNGRLVGALPAFIRRSRGLRVCRFLGEHESALADLLVDPTEPAETAVALVDDCDGAPTTSATSSGCLPNRCSFARRRARSPRSSGSRPQSC